MTLFDWLKVKLDECFGELTTAPMNWNAIWLKQFGLHFFCLFSLFYRYLLKPPVGPLMVAKESLVGQQILATKWANASV